MPDQSNLREATVEEIEWTLAFAVQSDGRKRFDTAREAMARIVATHLRKYLESSNFVIMKKPPAAPHTAGGGPDSK